MEYLGWTVTDPEKLGYPGESVVYAINKKGERFTAESIDHAMRIIRIKTERNIEVEIVLDEED